ncbi:FecR family protein [Sphingomonas abietis]|uniref:FecR domain-containing protein n=1 Tax=Sphingomonas abietis TaxID=3012344 RepID=A0ABY7NVF7_9SPHN|nr:FecR domain-containing protein [Sphingomonas abietis]WBO23894.1 FecR domain-containing protein [Sphingomonas abietis]
MAEQAEHWVARLASGEIEAKEMSAFKAWLAAAPEHRAAFDRERALWQSLEGKEAAFASTPPPPRRSTRPAWVHAITPRRTLAAAVAAAAIVLATPNAVVHLQADQMAVTGEVRTIALPDGSTAMLDTDAAIAIRFGPDERRIKLLRGRAWFDVKHDDARPFRVAALGGVTQDVGTAFEVSRDDDDVTVGVTKGVVRVAASESGDGLLVHALGRVRYASSGHVERLTPATADNIAAWRRGLIVIDGRSVSDAIAEVARYRPGLTLTLADTSGQPKVSGVFRTDAPDVALQTLAHMARLRVATLPAGVAIIRR